MQHQYIYRSGEAKLYSPEKMLKFKRILEVAMQKGQPRYFEIVVDGIKVIQRTNDISEFDLYEEHIDEDTNEVIMFLYSDHPTSPRHTRHVLRLKPTSPIQNESSQSPYSLNGTNTIDMESRIKEMLDKRDLEHENKTLKEKLQERESKLKEAEEYISKLHNGIDVLKDESQNKQSLVMDRLLKLAENPPDWVKLWMISGKEEKTMSGVENKEPGEVSIKRKRSHGELTEEQKQFIRLMKQMQQGLEKEEYQLLIKITDKLIEEPDLIPDVASLIDIELQQEN